MGLLHVGHVYWGELGSSVFSRISTGDGELFLAPMGELTMPLSVMTSFSLAEFGILGMTVSVTPCRSSLVGGSSVCVKAEERGGAV